MALHDAEHVLLTSFVPQKLATVERIVAADDRRVGYWTPQGEEEIARFAQPQTVTLQVCSRGGRPVAEEPLLEGTAEVLTEGPVFDQIKAKIHDKYGLGLTLETAGDKFAELFGKTSPEAVVVVNVVG